MAILGLAYAECVLDYVLQFEKEDFALNVSNEHVYFYAYAARWGVDEAKKMLTLVDLENQSED